MNTSATIDILAPALLKAQTAIPVIHKDSSNPFFKSSYLSLEGLLGAVRAPLAVHGFAIVQSTRDQDDGGMTVVTRLLHTSGQWIESGVRLPLAEPTPQAAGSAFSYGKRYTLEAVLGITGSDDDDGNEAQVRQINASASSRTATITPRNAEGVLMKPDTLGGRHLAVKDGTVTTTPPCPKCNGSMWDNRVGKKNPKAPDFKCRDKACDGVIWPPKANTIPAAAVAGPAFDEVPAGLLDEDPY